MEFSTQRQSLYWLLGLCLFLFKTECIDAQSKRASRLTNSRSFGTNVKPTSTNGINFDCPEEFGYYPHPTDCTQYYVCVFGGALLESCTGGLMYSHELQTCDWPRNVGCELVDSGTSASSTDVGSAPRNKVQQQQHQQHVPSRIRFGAAFTSPGSTQKAATVPPQYHRSPPQIIQAQVQHIPPPPELRVPPNPIVTSRGQPKTLLESQEEIAKLYTEAEESLPPVEEEESDRQQRVYRGQPSTVSQVQRDRDGIIHQASINAIPNHGKIGSYTFGSAYSESLNNDITIEPELPHNRLDLDRRRKRRSVIGLAITTPAEIQNDSNISSEVMESDSSTNTNLGSDSNNSQEHFDEAAPTINHVQKFSSKYSIKKYDYNQKEIEFGDEDEDADSDYEQLNDDRNDTDIAESKRRPRQLRPFSHASLKWPTNNYRSIDSPSAHQLNTQKNGYTFGHYNPYLTPPNQQTSPNHNYNELSQNLGYKAYPQQQHQHQQQQQQHQQQAPNYPYAQKPTLVYTGYNLSLPPPPIEDDFRPIPGNYYGAASSTSSRPSVGYQEQSQNSDLLPYLIQQLKELKERRKQIQTENFAYFHLDNQPIAPTQLAVHTTTPRTSIEYYSTSKPPQQVTPIGHYAQYSTMGGFYNNNNNNNKAEQAPNHSSYPVKLISQYSIGQGQELQSTTESNYFQYNIIANQKMKGVYNTAKLNQIEHAAVKVRPPVTPLQVTPNFNIVSAPDLSNNKQVNLHPIPFRNISNLPVGITYASNTTLPESYQTFTKSMSSTALPKLESPISLATPKPHLTNFQFNINEFMANLKASDLASLSPAVNPLIKYFKQVSNDGSGNVRNALILRRPVTSTASVTTTRSPQKTRPIVASEPVLATTLATTRIVKGYESFDNSIRMHKSKENVTSTTPLPRLKNSGSRTTTTDTPVEFYDEDYDDGVDEDILPPSQMPPYMPMSETMAPPRPQVTTDRTTTSMPEKQQLQTGFMQATTTRRPFPHFAQHNQPIPGAGVPAFISFPSDIFQELKQRLPQLQGKPSSANQNIRVHLTSTTTTTTTTTPAPAKIRHTVRPQRTRGQQKWQAHIVDTSVVTERSQNQTNQGAANGKASISSGSLGGQHLNSIHSSSNVDRQRDIEYQQQQQPQQQPQQEQPQQYQPTVRQQQQQQQQSTYRPLEILTTSTPTQRPHYSNQPALSYNTDYDDTDVNAQIEQDSVYDHPTRTPQRTNNRNRGSTIYTNQDRDAAAPPNRGTHPPRTRPTLKPSGTIVSKAQEFVDIYRYPASRPDPIYPQPTPDKTAAKCRKDVCLLPDCYCGGKDIPGGLNVSVTPQIVLITFDDAINTINIELYQEIFNNKSRKNPNGCPWRGTFYLSHEWTDYGMVQDMYSDGHEMASHTVSHSFGEQFSQKKWTREIAGQREILAAYGGVKLSDVRGMRAPFLSVGGNKMYKMLYDSNFTYDSSMPVYENRPPSWPYTLDYKIFHDCMIPPCPTRSYPGVWQVPMVMWQDLNGGRCSMGDACSNPSDAEGVTKMIMKNFERHYTTNRAPFGLFYHAAWFTQPHHKEGFIKFLDNINAMQDVWIITNWQALQWVRDPTPTSRINSFQPFQCDYSDRPKRCNNPKVCNLWHKSGVRYMKTCQPCPDIYPWTGKSGIRSSRIDNEVEEPQP
ncbi:uncharacterized protein LOC117564552 isoform X11 [Drosophila albomicans]|uniref:Uncharacterized protein LOC117564552 isoform X11 n=1 Tax=Drosophila albomicans TaxID=7291 RepID=A0A9C6STG7_DROAB|nr:uncharacterized protein LOC117564552 isoform X11 [Drosophila albomicans]